MNQRIEWKQAFGVITISFTTSFILFMLTEIVWGDLIHSYLSKEYKLHQYSNINLILMLGLGLIFGISSLTNLIILKDYTEKSRIKCEIVAIVLTFILLYAISSVTVIIIYAKLYAGLSIVQKIIISPLFFSYFSVYIITPILFWILALVIFHVILLFLIKEFLVRNIQFKSKKKSTKNNSNKLTILG